jgi:predicted nucleotidyltransferase
MTTKPRHKPKRRVARPESAKGVAPAQTPRWYRGPNVPKSAIRRFAREVAEKFHPEKIILFGSHAYGKPHADSDVDILVIMPCRNELDQAVKISLAVDRPFPLDIIVRKPHNMKWRLAEGDDFLQEIVAKGKVLYEAPDGRMGAKSRKRLSGRKNARRSKSSTA